jgi:hypothetical protein
MDKEQHAAICAESFNVEGVPFDGTPHHEHLTVHAEKRLTTPFITTHFFT